ncbi:MAG: hypothetical protein ACEPOW_12830, partial [Bacteroidales bacterium]
MSNNLQRLKGTCFLMFLALYAGLTFGQGEKLAGVENASAKGDFNNISLTWNMPGEAVSPSWPETFDGSLFPPQGWNLKVSPTVDAPLENPDPNEKHWGQYKTSEYDGGDPTVLGSQLLLIDATGDKCYWLISPE